MKIYNKKSFAEGTFMLALGSLNLILDLINHAFEINSAILIIVLYFLGGGFIIRSLSHKFSKEDKLDKLDERNQLIELKSKSKAFRLTQIISFLSMLFLQVIGKIADYNGLIAVSIGLALAFSFFISMFAEIFTYTYYESKN